MDWSLIAPLVEAWKSHAYGAVALGALLLIVNVLTRIKTDAEWVQLLDSYPRVHALLSMARGLGIDPVKVFAAFVRLVKGTPPPPAASVAKDGSVEVAIPSEVKE